MTIIKKIETSLGQFLTRLGFGMQAKLIILFVVIKVIPLALLTVIAIHQFYYL